MNPHSSWSWPYFKWLFSEGLGFVNLPPFAWAGVLLAAGLIGSLALQKPFARGRWKKRYWLAFSQLLFYPAIIAVGVLFRVPTQPTPIANPAAERALDVLFYLSLAFGGFRVYLMKSVRWLAFCLVGLQEIPIFGALLVASMSVTGAWI